MGMSIMKLRFMSGKAGMYLILCVTVYSFIITTALSYLPSTIEREKKLEMEYSLIQQPSGAILHSYKTTRKGINVWISASYTYKQTSDKILEHFDKELFQNDWHQIQYREYPDKKFTLKEYRFKKEDMEFVMVQIDLKTWSFHLH